MMLSYLEVLRIPNAVMSVFAVIVSAILVGFYNPLQILIACLAVFLISGGGMVINDYFDYNADRINRPKRALPSGRISRKNALVYSLALFLMGNILVIFLNFQMLIIALLNTFLLVVYSWRLKKTILLGNLMVSYVSASIFLFGSLLSNSITVTILILFLIAFSASMGREITKSVEDMKGDKKIKARTLPLTIDKNFSAWIAIFFIIFAVLFSALPYVFHLLSINYLFLIIISDAAFLYSCLAIMISPHKSQRVMKIAMFVALIAFLIGIF
jgi:geranylgeranylglycerol-phosphate geranylgeranyltransferase